MGLFDFLTRQSGREGQAGTDPRCDHYSFAHSILRKAAVDNPTKCVTALASTDGDAFLAELWNEVIDVCEEYKQPVNVSPDDILIHKLRIGPFPCTLLEMPAAQFPTEAFFVAIVLTVDMTDQSGSVAEHSMRYLTLEHKEIDDDEIQTVVGEWMNDDTHVSHGDGPDPELEGFVAHLTELVCGRNLN